jgi:alkylhydroperoxidase family enzyme
MTWDALLTHLGAAARHASPDVPADLAGFVDTITRHAYRVTDRDVAELIAAGHTEDELFEVAVLAAAAAADRRLHAALRAMAAH